MNSNNCVSPKDSRKQPNKHLDSPQTLRIRSIKNLASILYISNENLIKLAENASEYYRTFSMVVKGKRRHLIEAKRPLKKIQRRILENILCRLPRSECSYGQTRGKTIKDNAMVHAKSKYILKLDIKDFYPSIHSTKVYKFFRNEQECSPDVAHILTALTTYDYSLPLGTSTSPMIADLIVKPVDIRINGIANKVGLKYTRFVDDITLSGNFPLDRITGMVIKVLKQTGFKTKKEKLIYYSPFILGDDRIITGVSIKDGKISAPLNYVLSLEAELKDAILQSKQSNLTKEFQIREHYRGKITFVKWLDPKLGEKLLKLYRKVKWSHLEWMLKQNSLNN